MKKLMIFILSVMGCFSLSANIEPSVTYKIENEFNKKSEIYYHYIEFTAKNFPLETPLKLEIEKEDKTTLCLDFTVDEKGQLINSKNSKPIILCTYSGKEVKKIIYQIKSADHEILASGLVSLSLLSVQDGQGHYLALIPDGTINEIFILKASGFKPFEKVQFISISGKEKLSHPVKMSEKGELFTMLCPATIGHLSDIASVELKGKTTDALIVNYKWGS